MFSIVLYRPQIPPNTGNIARLCAATGTHLHLVGPLGFALSDRYLKRAGLDYWPWVHLSLWSSWEELQKTFSQARFLFFETEGSLPYWDAQFQPGDFLVFGSETFGLPTRLLSAGPCFYIPISQREVRSLNLSNSVALVLYEALRQNRTLLS
ncbi:tRNA (cytidine(34)-2'-O)-methyltransferase [Candidatus Methylacidithermus pantelleriae]|uniref:Putative tRNA (cytidine(34)-2'-O)-methyltransferase n=1 Tax=Candidatus Methylacidithermus pantelleriae TaxID=2744239 RepID=A0A8J2BQ70_9BACT|nr:tRNA (cytidine(34)-2'-O)-methyltransferase [Candidatus Methylacidithermus pantelleriae]CAF0700954.1 Putative tRNA (cytidine(34)-2\\'-O)-methyltransferase [Candidatus Methylacidithermus pantelleriae]